MLCATPSWCLNSSKVIILLSLLKRLRHSKLITAEKQKHQFPVHPRSPFISRPRAVDYISIYKVILFGFENHLLMFLKVLMTLYLDSYTSASLPHLRHGRVSTHSPLTIPVTDFEPLHTVCAVFLERLVDCWFVH